MILYGLRCDTTYSVIARALFENGTQEGPGVNSDNTTTTASCPTEPATDSAGKIYVIDTNIAYIII